MGLNRQALGFDPSALSGKQGLLLDIDNTLYTYEPLHKAALQASFQKAQIWDPSLSWEAFKAAHDLGRQRVHTDLHGQGASHSRLLYFQKASEALYGRSRLDWALDLEEAYWGYFLQYLELAPEAAFFIAEAEKQGIPIAIVTDLTAAIQMRKLIRLGLAERIAFLVSSEEAGVEKPHPYMFLLACEKLGLSPQTCLMVGDSLEKDIRGAQQLGAATLTISWH